VVLNSDFLNIATHRRSYSGHRLDSSDSADYEDEVRQGFKSEILFVHVTGNRTHGDLCH